MPRDLLPGEILQQMIEEKGWTQAELARRAHRGRSVINEVVSGRHKVGRDLGVALARAFNIPPDVLFQRLGLFPPDPDSDPITEEGIHILRQLEGEYKHRAIRLLKVVAEEQGDYDVSKRKRRPASSG